MRYLAAGIGYGIALFLFGFACAGAGHGSYLPFAIYSAPLSFLNASAALFGAPFLWAFVGFTLATGPRWLPIALLAIHATGAGVGLTFGTRLELPEEQWERFASTFAVIPMPFLLGFALYMVGQAVAWRLAVRRCWRRTKPNAPTI